MANEAEVLERPAQAGAAQAEPDIYVKCGLIDEGFNYRRKRSPQKDAELRADMKQRAAGDPRNALIYPVLLRILDNGRFQLIAGGRRTRQFREEWGDEAEIRARARRMTDVEATALMMAENGGREDPSVIEDAEGAARMLGYCNGDKDEAASRLGWKREKLDKRLALMNAHQAVRDAYLEEKIHQGHVEIFAALRQDVQQVVIEKILAHGKVPTVEQLKALAEQALLSLEAAIFDKTACSGCQYNTGFQQAMFEQSFSGSRCTNKECYTKKTEAELEVRKAQLEETYQVVRIVRPGDNSTVIALSATDGKRPVGAEQLTACRTCGDFGACVSGVPDSLGKVYRGVCFNKQCNDEKVAAFRAAQQQPSAPSSETSAQAPAEGGAGASEAKSGAAPSTKPESAPATKASPNSVRNQIREYREGVWRAVYQRAVLKLPVKDSRALLAALTAHHSSYLDGKAAVDAASKQIGSDLPTIYTNTKKQLAAFLQLDQNQLAIVLQHLPAFVSSSMPIGDIVGYLKALEIKLEQHWRVNEAFFDVLTKTELDAVCDEIGLAKAAGKTYTSLKNGSKKDFVAGMLKVEGFEYLGAIPKLMRW